MCFKNVIKSGKRLKSVKTRFCLYGHCFFLLSLQLYFFIFSTCVETLHTSEIKSCCIFKRKTQFKIRYHYENMPVQYTEIFKVVKNENFQKKNVDIFLIFVPNIDCGYTLEPPRRGGSNEYPQSVLEQK